MRVFCRFAPRKGDASQAERRMQVVAEDIEDGRRMAVTVAESLTGGNVSLACERAFFPLPSDPQSSVFEAVVEPMLPQIMSCKKLAVLCYGQTSTGKTHTIMGPEGGKTSYFNDSEICGIVPRLPAALFALGTTMVDVRYYEIYNETVFDIIARLQNDVDNGNRKTEFRPIEKPKIQRSLARMTCRTESDLLRLLVALSDMRHVSATDANCHSSRSHVVLQLTVFSEEGKGQLTVADLAGSESLKSFHMPKVSGDIFERHGDSNRLSAGAQTRLFETKNINTSLFALKKVVQALHSRSRHIPYKDSMLTTMLEECIAPQSALIACCSSDGSDVSETFATLRFAMEASKIQPPSQVVQAQRLSIGRAPQDVSVPDDDFSENAHRILETDITVQQLHVANEMVDTLTQQCELLSTSYEDAVRTIDELRNELKRTKEAHNSEVDSLRIEVSCLKNELRLLDATSQRSFTGRSKGPSVNDRAGAGESDIRGSHPEEDRSTPRFLEKGLCRTSFLESDAEAENSSDAQPFHPKDPETLLGSATDIHASETKENNMVPDVGKPFITSRPMSELRSENAKLLERVEGRKRTPLGVSTTSNRVRVVQVFSPK